MRKGQKTRARLLDQAAQIIANDGIKGLTARSLADQANVSVGLVSHHFPNLNDMMFEVVKYVFATFPSAAAQDLPPLQMIEDLAIRNFEFFAEHSHYYKCLLLSYFYTSFDERLRDFHSQNLKKVKARITFSLRQLTNWPAKDLSEMADSIMDIIEGALLFTIVEKSSLKASRKRTLAAIRLLLAQTQRG